jgi:hypothetical protein
MREGHLHVLEGSETPPSPPLPPFLLSLGEFVVDPQELAGHSAV